MNVNRRLTTRLLKEAVTVTKSICVILLEGILPKASGFSLDNSSFKASFPMRDERGLKLARASAWMFDPVPATQLLSVGGGAASGR